MLGIQLHPIQLVGNLDTVRIPPPVGRFQSSQVDFVCLLAPVWPNCLRMACQYSGAQPVPYAVPKAWLAPERETLALELDTQEGHQRARSLGR